MSTPPVRFEQVWKKFHRGEMHDSLRDLIPSIARRLTGRGQTERILAEGDFWALSDVSFDVDHGDALGIIGPNGAGKSTILKLLTRVVRPTRGSSAVQGRVGALIELGAGFHPDLTGRENVYLQGSIMGMRRAEIDRKFDDIVAFAGVSDFIDTPVKRYSSGMHARLGFSVAAQLDPDVLIIDEVLGVGDAAFQRKAFEYIEGLRKRQVPLVVVSHQLDRINQFCTAALLLDRGKVRHIGTPQETIDLYLNTSASLVHAAPPDVAVLVNQIDLHGVTIAPSGTDVTVTLRGSVQAVPGADRQAVTLMVQAAERSEPVFSTNTALCGLKLPAAGEFTVDFKLQMNVPSMLYTIRSRTWDVDSSRELHTGPSAQLRISEGAPFYGPVQMNPRVRLQTPSPVQAVVASRTEPPVS